MGAAMFAALAGAPLLLGLTRPAEEPAKAVVTSEVPGVVGLYANGLTSLGIAGLVALPLAMIFAIWLMAGQQREVNRRFLGKGARNRRNLIEASRTLAIIVGSVGLIVGSLAGLYAAMMTARPDLKYELPIPFFTFELAVPCLLIGGALYAAGRLGR
jgi:hypothetical protein